MADPVVAATCESVLRTVALFLFCASFLFAMSAPAAEITLTASVANGTTAAGVYLAIVAEDRAWSDPTRETITTNGGATWQIPPGTYRALAGAPGFCTQVGEPFTIAASDVRKLGLELKPLSPISGLVLDEAGHPISRALITRAATSGDRDFVLLSAMGQRLLRSNMTAETSTIGAFTVLTPGPENQTLLVEAPGYSPAVAATSHLNEDRNRTIVLRHGASLHVRWSGPPVNRREKVSLLPIDAAMPEGLTRELAVVLWTRPAAGNEQQWQSLPLGTYKIVLRAASVAPQAAAPADLGEVILAPGDDKTVSIALPPETRTTDNSLRAITLLIAGASEVEDALLTQWRDGTSTRLSPKTQLVSGGILLAIDLPCASGSSLVIETRNAIGSAGLDGKCAETLRTTLAPRAYVAARVTVPSGVGTPRSGFLRFGKCGSDRSAIEIPFAVVGGRMHASVPVGCDETSFRAPGFAMVRLTTGTLTPAETRDLGTIALRQGAAVAVRVRSGKDAQPLPGVRVTAVRAHDLATMRYDLQTEQVGLGSALTDSAGWARIAGLPEEHVVFLLQGPSRRHPQISEPYALQGGEETVLDDILLEVPSTVFVTVSVPSSLVNAIDLDKVVLYPSGHSHWPKQVPIRGVLTSTGAAVEDVPPGTWSVRASGRLKNGFAITAAEQTVDVVSGADRHVSLSISDLLYQGRVTRGGSPVSGVINLNPVDRRRERRTALATVAADGTFQVLLETRGQYSVKLQDATTGAVTTLNRYVMFDDPDDEVAVQLPTARIRGRVVDSTGAPVGGAGVSAEQQLAEPAGRAGARNTADGSFVIEGVSPGTWEVVAESGAGRSEPVTVAVGASDIEGITVILEPTSTVRLRLVDVTGTPLPDTFIAAELLAPGAAQSKSTVQRTNADGLTEFRLTRPQQETLTNLVVATPDIRLSCALLRLDNDQTIQVGPSYAEVRLVGRKWEANRGVSGWLVSSSGCAVPFLGTHFEQDSTGAKAVVFPRLAPGTWSYVETRSPQELAAILTGRASTLFPIKTFAVEAGKILRVDLPHTD